MAYIDDVRPFIKKIIDKNTFCYQRSLKVITEHSSQIYEPQHQSDNNIESMSKPQKTNKSYFNEIQSPIAPIGSTPDKGLFKQQNMTVGNPNTNSEIPPSKPINIKIINNNYNHYIINQEKEAKLQQQCGINSPTGGAINKPTTSVNNHISPIPQNADKKASNTNINTFRKSYISSYDTQEKKPQQPIKPEAGRPINNSFINNVNSNINNKYNMKVSGVTGTTQVTHEIKNPIRGQSSQMRTPTGLSTKPMINSKILQPKFTSFLDNPSSGGYRPSSAINAKQRSSRDIKDHSSNQTMSFNIQRVPSANTLLRNNSNSSISKDRNYHNNVNNINIYGPISGSLSTRPLVRGNTPKYASNNPYNIKTSNYSEYNSEDIDRRGYSLSTRSNHIKITPLQKDSRGFSYKVDGSYFSKWILIF
jgi:hypothetical protein